MKLFGDANFMRTDSIFGTMKELKRVVNGEEIANAVIGCSVFLVFISLVQLLRLIVGMR